MPTTLSLPSSTYDPIILADWLELLAISSADGNASHGDLQTSLNILGQEDSDSICASAMQEIHKRVGAAREHYPFNFTGSLLTLKEDWVCYVPYVFCLLLSYCDDKKKKVKGYKHEMMFEQLSCLAARSYIGGEVLRFGSPRTDLPRGFLDALKYLSSKVMEWTPSGTRSLKRKDGGLDLVAWKPFADEHIGKLILFGHCASGGDWKGKINELIPSDFCANWLGAEKSPIVKTFFIPHRLPQEEYDVTAVSAKLFFDRCRIALFVSNDEFNAVTDQNSIAWCRGVLGRVSK